MGVEQERAAAPDRKVGRKRDSTRDTQLLAAAIEILSEVGYDRMTMDMVAERVAAGKATAYRRWPSKAEMVREAIRFSARTYVDLENLPDTGSLRGDMLALFAPYSVEEGERTIKAMASIASLIAQGTVFEGQPDLIADPWAAAHERLIRRAVERGEIPQQPDLAAMARIIPALVIYQAMIARRIADLPFLTMIVDDVLLPALRARKVR